VFNAPPVYFSGTKRGTSKLLFVFATRAAMLMLLRATSPAEPITPRFSSVWSNGAEADPPSAGLADCWAESFSIIICCNTKALTELFIVVTLKP